MTLIASVVLAVLLTLCAIQLQRIVVGYRSATGTPWQRFLAAFSHSQTVLLARVGTALSAFLAFAINFLPYMDPDSVIGKQIAAYVPPQYAPLYLLVFSIAVEYVRRRPGSVDPVTVPPQAVVIPPPPPVEVVPNA